MGVRDPAAREPARLLDAIPLWPPDGSAAKPCALGEVGAIHGRLLTAWSVADVLGPLIVNAIADSQKTAGKSGPDLYIVSFWLIIGLLVVGFICNELIKQVDPKHHAPTPSDDDLLARDAVPHKQAEKQP